MRRMNAIAAVMIVSMAGLAGPAPAGVTAYEGARLIVGDGARSRTRRWSSTATGSCRPAGRQGARRRHARESGRQDRDADDHRHARASQHDARGPHRAT